MLKPLKSMKSIEFPPNDVHTGSKKNQNIIVLSRKTYSRAFENSYMPWKMYEVVFLFGISFMNVFM